jgi:hypothetical protein
VEFSTSAEPALDQSAEIEFGPPPPGVPKEGWQWVQARRAKAPALPVVVGPGGLTRGRIALGCLSVPVLVVAGAMAWMATGRSIVIGNPYPNGRPPSGVAAPTRRIVAMPNFVGISGPDAMAQQRRGFNRMTYSGPCEELLTVVVRQQPGANTMVWSDGDGMSFECATPGSRRMPRSVRND